MNRRIPNGTYGGVRGMNNPYSIGERSEPISRMLIMPYDTESQSRNADFISIALRAIHHLQRQSRCCPLSEANTTLLHNLPPTGGYNLRPGGPSTFLFITLLHNPRRKPRPFLICARQGATTTFGLKGRQT